MSSKQSIIVIGAGYGGMSAAARLAHAGYAVTVFEKNDQPGGRASVLKQDGFTFDLGPSWYMMPELFDDLFTSCGRSRDDYYSLTRLDPSYRVFFEQDQSVSDVSADIDAVITLFESWESGAGVRFKQYLADVETMYEVGVGRFIDRPFLSIKDLLDPAVLSIVWRSGVFRSYAQHIRSTFSSQKIQQILEFPTVFLGGIPQTIPALYTLISHADFGKKIWYPDGGFGAVSRGFEQLCKDCGVQFVYGVPVERVLVENDKAVGVFAGGEELRADIVVANADYQFVETMLLPKDHQTYRPNFWKTKAMSPSVLLWFLGIDVPLPALQHHNFFFNDTYDTHLRSIYAEEQNDQWLQRPQLYVSCPSVTDSAVAPKGMSNLFVLVPVSPGFVSDNEITETLFDYVVETLSRRLDLDLRSHIVTMHHMNVQHLQDRYNAYKGNAFGLGHTLRQSFLFRPKNKSKKLQNLYYTGHYTNPGTGTPLAVVSGKIVYDLIRNG